MPNRVDSLLITFLFLFGVIAVTIMSSMATMYFNVMTYPKLGKKILHDSGVYYIEYNEKKQRYRVFKDFLVIKKSIFGIDDDEVHETSTITRKVKSFLDSAYQEKTKRINRLKSKKKILSDWDGYTSIDLGRDDKIKKIVG